MLATESKSKERFSDQTGENRQKKMEMPINLHSGMDHITLHNSVLSN